MDERFLRTSLVLGDEAIETLNNKHIAIFGIGGVGSACMLALARAGIKEFTIIDNDEVSISNINRQLIAYNSTVGMKKVDVAEKMLKDISEDVIVHKYDTFVLDTNINNLNLEHCDYLIDCIDTVTGKLAIIKYGEEHNIKVISSMGTGNKIYPDKLEIGRLSKTSVCPLARIMRYEVRKRKLKDIYVLYSKEEPITPKHILVNEENKKVTPGSVSFVPPVAGMMIAGFVIRTILNIE